MAASQEPVYMYPDPSLFGLNALPPPQDSPLKRPIEFSTDPSPIPAVTPPAPHFIIDPTLLELDRPATRPLADAATMATAPAPASAPVPAPVPALIVAAPAPAQAPIPGPVPAMRPSAAGLQPFPELVPGLQAPRELMNTEDITLWNNRLDVSLRTDHMGLRVRKDGSRKRDLNDKSKRDRQSKARKDLKILWEKAGGAPYVPKKAYNRS